ncbi:hypothetical protein HOLleu_11993 [Holothuria leucospilota]|uniref:Ig-like domain-containing protein n=1 Tax=Holothuria leucospilota TaxID=206669 RepID=A0A9Q1CAQ0_HOLLE|nr:hypothetical protein HOLleu_11993 [Holothuria leucospilota]
MYDQLPWKREMSIHWTNQNINSSVFFKPLVIIAFTALFASQTFSKVIETPENGTYLEGTDILLTCLVEGTSENIIWEDVEEDIKIFIGRSKYTTKDKYQNFYISKIQKNYSLIISDATESDEGLYSCNEMDMSYLAKVTVEVLPNLNLYASGISVISTTDRVRSYAGDEPVAFSRIIEIPDNGTYLEGTDILLTCLVEGANENIIWKDVEEDIKIFIGRSKYTMKDKYQNFFISQIQGNYSLIISGATKSDEGFYSCNEMDTSYLAKVTIEVLPSLNLYVSGTSIISATDQAKANASDESVDAYIFWKVLGTWTVLILVICCAVALVQLALQRSCSHGNSNCGATCKNRSSTTDTRNCEGTANNGGMIFERTMVNDLGLIYAVPNKHSFSKDSDLIIHEDQNKTNYATVVTNFGSEEHL